MERSQHKICIGQFVKPHGVYGTLLLSYDEGYEEMIADQQVLFVESDGILVPWFITEEGVRITSSKTALVDLDWIDDNLQAKKLAGRKVWITSNNRHDGPLADPVHLLTGYSVLDMNAGMLGTITEINDYSGNLVLTIDAKGNELLVPLHDDLIVKTDEKKRSITLKLPEGLISL